MLERAVNAARGKVKLVKIDIDKNPVFAGQLRVQSIPTVYAFAAGMLCPAFDNELRKHTATKKNLVAYADRMREQYWKE